MENTSYTSWPRLEPVLQILINGVRAVLRGAAGGLLPRGVYAGALRKLRIAESLLRRSALLMAVELDIAPRAAQAHAPHGGRRQNRPPRPRLFPMFEPWGHAALPPGVFDPSKLPDEARPAAPLSQRFERLVLAAAAPERLAARMAVWMRGRERRLQADVTPRSRPEQYRLRRPGQPPGLTRRDRSDLAALLRDLNWQAARAYPP